MKPTENQELREAWRERLDDLLKERVRPALVVDEILATIQHYKPQPPRSHVSFIANIMEAVSPVVFAELAKAWDDLDAAKLRLAEIHAYAESMSLIGDGSIGEQLIAVVEGRAEVNGSGFVVSTR